MPRHVCKSLLHPAFLTLVLSACTSLGPKPIPAVVLEKTKMPSEFTYNSYPKLPEKIFVPSSLLDYRYVGRSHVEVREGPKATYKIKEYILPYGTQTVVIAAFRNWRKILLPANGETGWVHYRVLHPIVEPELLAINPEKLPIVIVKRPIDCVYNVENNAAIKTQIALGRAFIVLKEEKDRYLVWLKETDSVAWIKQSNF